MSAVNMSHCSHLLLSTTRNKSALKVIINDIINLFVKTAISILVISNRGSFRELFDKTASVYIAFEKKYIYILALEMASPGNRHCANCTGTLSFPICPPRAAAGHPAATTVDRQLLHTRHSATYRQTDGHQTVS